MTDRLQRKLKKQPVGQRTRWLFQRLVPDYAAAVLDRLEQAGFQAYFVGGCVRDLLLQRPAKDWDVATDATPEQVMAQFDKTRPTGIKHGTVTVILGQHALEVTTFRQESGYSDHRHPDRIIFQPDVEDDLARRDLTINAMAMSRDGRIIDPFGGLADLKSETVRAVGDPGERFSEDALRMMRVIRFAAELGFAIDRRTYDAVAARAHLLQHVSAERIRDEFSKSLLSEAPGYAVELLKDSGLLAQFFSELLEGVGFAQNKHHKYTVWEHNVLALDGTPPRLHLRLAGLLHDVAKPRCLFIDEDGARHFYHHETVGAEMAENMLDRLRFDNETRRRVVHLIRHHLALHHYPKMSDAAIRRLINRVGLDHLDDLIFLRRADRWASGTKKGPVSAGTRHLLQRIEKILAEDAAFGLADLAVDGHDVMEVAGIEPGPRVGEILQSLLEEVLDDPSLNEPDKLRRRIKDMVSK